MSPSDMLLTVAELSLALAGFSGVVAGIQGARQTASHKQNEFGLIHILASSGAALTFSMLPFALQAAGVSEPGALRGTTLALGVLIFLAALQWTRIARSTRPRSPAVFWGFVGSGFVLGLALVVTASGVVTLSGSLLPIALLWLLLVGFAQFATFLLLGGRGQES